MALDGCGGNPERLARAIHDQLGELTGPVPVHAIARALDIEEIREEPLHGFEGALITTPERSFGAIVVNARSSPARRRYTIGHELGHFLNPWHEPTTDSGFQCTGRDMTIFAGDDRHRQQEAEANRFSIELLAPIARLKLYLSKHADLGHALAMAQELEISKMAAVRRYVSLHPENLAVVFSRNRVMSYFSSSGGFPRLAVRSGDRLPDLAQPPEHERLSQMEETDPADWLQAPRRAALYAQTLHQAEGYAMTVLLAETAESLDDIGDDPDRDDLGAPSRFGRGR